MKEILGMGRIAVLGAGNIGMAIAEGLAGPNSDICGHIYASGGIILTRKSSPFSANEQSRFACGYDNKAAVSAADIIIIAPEPEHADEVLNEIVSVLEDQLLISVVSGLSIRRIEELIGRRPIVRAMPNIAIEAGDSMTCVSSNEKALSHTATVATIFSSIGEALWISEEMFPAATVFAASSVAMFLRFYNTQMACCRRAGFTEPEARLITIQVAKGVLALISAKEADLEADIKRISTSGGCTVEMLSFLDKAHFEAVIAHANDMCLNKAEQLYAKK